MHLMYTLDPNGKRIYTLKKVLHGEVTKSAHPARFSPDDKYSRHRVTLKRRYGLLITQEDPQRRSLRPPLAPKLVAEMPMEWEPEEGRKKELCAPKSNAEGAKVGKGKAKAGAKKKSMVGNDDFVIKMKPKVHLGEGGSLSIAMRNDTRCGTVDSAADSSGSEKTMPLHPSPKGKRARRGGKKQHRRCA